MIHGQCNVKAQGVIPRVGNFLCTQLIYRDLHGFEDEKLLMLAILIAVGMKMRNARMDNRRYNSEI